MYKLKNILICIVVSIFFATIAAGHFYKLNIMHQQG